jgi:hypothetical protein
MSRFTISKFSPRLQKRIKEELSNIKEMKTATSSSAEILTNMKNIKKTVLDLQVAANNKLTEALHPIIIELMNLQDNITLDPEEATSYEITLHGEIEDVITQLRKIPAEIANGTLGGLKVTLRRLINRIETD